MNEEEEDLTPVMLADASKPQHQRREQDDEEREIHDSGLSENSKLELDDPPTAKPFSASGFDSTNSKENGDNQVCSFCYVLLLAALLLLLLARTYYISTAATKESS